jgi:hypothetical protein
MGYPSGATLKFFLICLYSVDIFWYPLGITERSPELNTANKRPYLRRLDLFV